MFRYPFRAYPGAPGEAGWRGWVWVCVAGVLAGLVLAQPAVLFAAAGLAVVVAASLAWHLPRPAAFAVERRVLPEAVFTGDSAEVRVEVRNRTFLPCFFCRLEEPWPQGLELVPGRARVFTLWPRGKAGMSYRVLCRRKGVYAFGAARLEMWDPLGFHGRVLEVQGGGVLTVYPRVYPVAAAELRPAEPYGKHRSPDRSVENPASLKGVRDYEPGDPPGRIHWKLSAHTGELKTREFDLTGCGTLEILCDLDGAWLDPGGELLEFECSLAASLAHAALSAGDAVGLHYLGRGEAHLSARSGVRQFEAILALLTEAEPGPGAGLGTAVTRLRGLAPRSTVFLLSAAPPEMLLESVALLRGRGHPVAVVLMGRVTLETCRHLVSLGARVWRPVLEEGELRLVGLEEGGAV